MQQNFRHGSQSQLTRDLSLVNIKGTAVESTPKQTLSLKARRLPKDVSQSYQTLETEQSLRPRSLLEMAGPASNAVYQSVELRHPPNPAIGESITNLS